jgi:aminoglycoside 6'-N-acetyltransferase I
VSIEIKVLRAGDEAVLTHVGPEVFDHAIDQQATREFLIDPRHHLVVAIDDGVVVGFTSGVHYAHPDKPRPELWVNEIGVAATHRGRGLGKALLGALLGIGRELGCPEAWVLTERTNAAALALYSSSGGTEAAPDPVMFTFRLQV